MLFIVCNIEDNIFFTAEITWRSLYIVGPQSHIVLRCTGSEQRLQDCPYTAVYSQYNYQIYLKCQPLLLSSE